MTGNKQQLEGALWLLARGSSGENDLTISIVRNSADLDENQIRWELHALRLFAVESGAYLGCSGDPGRYDRLLAALYGPMVREYREDSNPQASLDFQTLKARVEMYRRVVGAAEESETSPENLVRRVGQLFAELCKATDANAADAGSSVFMATARQAKHVAELVVMNEGAP
jgi:hypothetical protein